MLLPDMGKAVARLQQALATDEVIGVFGDFDVDGLTGTALLVHALQDMGSKVIPYLPDRVDEGHGLNDGAIRSLRARNVSLLLTIDCGSSSAKEVELASSLGMDTIITDHHSLPTTPPDALAVVNPRRSDSSYPYSGLTGAGLSFKLVEALWAALGRPRPDHLLDLVALGTIADVGPLTGENRYMVSKGLELLNNTPRVGLKALISRSGLKSGFLDTESLSFWLTPMLNAAGRLGEASTSLDLLNATNSETAQAIAEKLERLNIKRRQLTEEGVAQARRQVEARFENIPPIIFVQHKEWLPGILGIIAGNLTESFYRPVVAVSVDGQVCRASARSIPEFDIVEALRGSRSLFHRFGGHPRAAGFTLSSGDLPRLERNMMMAAEEKLDESNLAPSIDIDCEVSPALFDDYNLSFIQSLSPFGEGNPSPVFLTRNARIAEVRRVGEGGNHLKMRISHGGRTWDAIAFGQGDRMVGQGSSLDLVYRVGVDHWGGPPKLQLTILDFQPQH